MVALLVRIFSICADFLMAFIGFDMIRQRRRARILALKFIPFLAIIGILHTGMGISTGGLAHPTLVKVIVPLFMALRAGFYLWLYRFFRNKNTEGLMTVVV
jgi:hypothetical protein